jgi:dTDP-glucose 4,6-dehydratase
VIAVVSGSAGFIGSYVCEALSAAGWQFVTIDNLTDAAVNADFVYGLPGLRAEVRGDVADPAVWRRALYLTGPHPRPPETWKVDAVFHLAAETHVDRSLGLDPTTLAPLAADPVEGLYRTNVIGTVRAAEFARSVGARLVHWSTDEVYGDALSPDAPAWDGGGYRPALELLRAGADLRGLLDRKTEDDPLLPSSPYAASKAAAEMAVHASVRLGLRATILRPSNAYGARQARDKLVPVAIGKLSRGEPVPLYDGGYQVRQWVHAEDIARAALKAVDLQWEGTVNVGGPSLLRNADLVEYLATAGNALPLPPHVDRLIQTVPDRPGHDVAYAVSSRRAERDLGWKPTRSIEQDAAELFAAYALPA